MSIMKLNAGNIFYFLYLISRAYLSRLKIDISSPFLKLEPIRFVMDIILYEPQSTSDYK